MRFNQKNSHKSQSNYNSSQNIGSIPAVFRQINQILSIYFQEVIIENIRYFQRIHKLLSLRKTKTLIQLNNLINLTILIGQIRRNPPRKAMISNLLTNTNINPTPHNQLPINFTNIPIIIQLRFHIEWHIRVWYANIGLILSCQHI